MPTADNRSIPADSTALSSMGMITQKKLASNGVIYANLPASRADRDNTWLDSFVKSNSLDTSAVDLAKDRQLVLICP